jgi:hypothetical protein
MFEGADKRRFPRAHYPCKIIVLKGAQSERFSTCTENIGGGGVCVALKKGLDKFCPVGIILYLEDGLPPLECDGRVVWVVRREGDFDTGIQFIHINPQDVTRIERIVQLCLKTGQDSAGQK